MRKMKFFIVGLFILSVLTCSKKNDKNKGSVVPDDFNYQTEFTTFKSIIVLPIQINGVSKNFLFDTGADYSLIQRDSIIGKIKSYNGASKRKMKLGKEIVKSIKIGNVDFINTVALNGNLIGLKEQVSNFGGLIGQPIIKKANWLIDYPNKTVEVSSKNLADSSFETIKIKRDGVTPYTYISINETKHKVMIDFGSSSDFNLPKESKLAKQLLEQHNFTNNERDRYTLGGLQKVKEKVGNVSLIKLGNIDFINVKTTINSSREPRIGIGFFRDCKIYIDSKNNNYKIKK